jgi:DMSO/TMAO reductase YedYZ molybdopterin-dependent catalytic subunit
MSDQPTKLTRRDVLRLAAIGLGGALVAACQRAVEPITRALATPTLSTAPTIVPPKIEGGIPTTANQDFYGVSIGVTPSVPANWKLTITGLVDQPLTLTLDEIKALPAVTEMRALMCISNPVGGDLTGNARWKGVRFKDLLAQAGVKSNARFLKLESFDQFSTGIPLELGMDDAALLVYEMNGEPLPLDHGAPLRCLFPGRYGMKQPKWIQTISAVEEEYIGFWEKQGWSDDARLKPFSRIDAPKDNSTITGATFMLVGIAFSDEGGLLELDISWDDAQQWSPAQLTRGPSPYTWTVWQWAGNALPPGRHTLYARATDQRGNMQTRGQPMDLLGGTFPDGTEQMHSIVLDFKS